MPRTAAPRRACAARRSRAVGAARRSGAGSALRSTLPFGVSGSASSTHERRRAPCSPAGAPRRCARSSADGGASPPAGRRRRRGACRRGRPRAPATTGLAHRRVLRRAPPRSRRARCGSRGSSPGGRRGRGTRAARRAGSAPGRRCGRAARRRRGERVGDEALGGQLGPVEVAARQAGAADVELAGHADGHRPQCASRT